ncbi:MAG: hypothetical protein ABSF08_01075 [Candidatus Cybelea sp.]|jgi:hypothetical protein
MECFFRRLLIALAIAGVSACGSGNNFTTPPVASSAALTKSTGGSLGPVLSTSDGGEIFGFDVDQNGNDGVLASASLTDISVQTFNATTGKITKTVGEIKGAKVARGDDYVADGIFDGDVGLVDFQKAGKPGQTPAKDMYHLLGPVTKGRFTARWVPSVKLFNVLQWAPNQSTSTAVVFGYQREGSDPSELLVSDVAKGTFGKVITLNANQFSLGTQPELTQDTVNNVAVMASSPSYGAAGGPPPEITTVDLHSGKLKQFAGVQCPGSVGCGYANGIGYDSATGIACTTTELDGGLEFYDLAKETGTHELLPNGGGQYYAGGFVANDPVNKLFLIAQPISSTSGSGSSIQVYLESGALLESINGFNFTYAGDFVIPVRISINPGARTGWVNGPGSNQLQEFSY